MDLAGVVQDRGDRAEAEGLLSESVLMSIGLLPSSGWQLAYAAQHLNDCLVDEGRDAVGEDLLVAAAGAMKLNDKVELSLRTMCIQVLVDHYRDWERTDPGQGHADEAREWQRQLDALQKQ
jgi:hypothetical protein